MPEVLVPPGRFGRWVDNFTARHGETTFRVVEGTLAGQAADGSTFRARLPWDASYAGEARPQSFAAGAVPPARWGVLLVRKGGFAVALLEADRMTRHKVGQRHVQGRTKAGGQSQQRFARRRDNQARQAFEAAADHADSILGGVPTTLVTGGDRAAVREVLADSRLTGLEVTSLWLSTPDPTRAVLDRAVADASSLRVVVTNLG